MSNLQITWVFIGIAIGLLMFFPIKRCLATHNGFLSMLIASLMGIFNVSFSWVAVVIAAFFFTFGIWKNQHKFLGIHNGKTN